ncbi:MAG: cohesin domain-containing protein [Candidatus Omnitrophica bacterium]|nr:cohesin domain-containing protein [Candidatus Omnitrophota bacterium]
MTFRLQMAIGIISGLALAGLCLGATIQVESITISSQPGSISIPVTIEAETPFASFQFTLRYNQNVLRLTGIDKGPLVGSFTVMHNTEVVGTVRSAGFDPGLAGVSGNGVLANLHFEVLQAGYSYLNLSEVKMSDAQGKPLACGSRSGFFRVATDVQSGTGGGNITGVNVQTGGGSATVSASGTSGGYTRVQVGETTVSVPSTSSRPAPFPGSPTTSVSAIPTVGPEKPGVLTPVQPESKKPLPESPSNSVVLLVKSDFGKTSPAPGITTYTKGDKVDCRVETGILEENGEQLTCVGYEGTGSAPTGTGSSVSFVIQEDSKLVWKWVKKPVEKEFVISAPAAVNFSQGEKEIKLPVKAIFLGGFNRPVKLRVSVPQEWQVSWEENELKPEKRETNLRLKTDKKVAAGVYQVIIEGHAGEMKKSCQVAVTVPGEVKLGQPKVDQKKKEVEASVLLSENIGQVASLQLVVEVPGNLKLKNLRAAAPEQKILNEIKEEKNILKVTAAIFPSASPPHLLSLIFDLKRPAGKDFAIKVKDASLWNENGEKIPVFLQP